MIITGIQRIDRHIDNLTASLESIRNLIAKAGYNKLEYRALAEAFDVTAALLDTLIMERDRVEP